MDATLPERARRSVERYASWLEAFGETSQDHQDFYAGKLGGRAKALYYRRPTIGKAAVLPFVLSEAFFPAARRWCWPRSRLPIADAHFAMGFALLAHAAPAGGHYEKAVHFLEVLKATRCPAYEHYCWGYPFDWKTRNGTIARGTPLITTTPYCYEAFAEVHRVDRAPQWLDIMRSIAEHARLDIRDREWRPGAFTCSYTPHDQGGVINASAYRAALLADASADFSEPAYWTLAERNVNFVLQNQRPDGSWPYAADDPRDFIDHFHTCFVLKGLAKVEAVTPHEGCQGAIARGVRFYLDRLFDDDGLPKPFAKAPRLTVYRNELYDYAECINLCLLLRGRFPDLDRKLEHVLDDLLKRWQRPDGSFRSRRLLAGWDNTPMHRWGGSQIFRSLCLFLHQAGKSVIART